MPLIQILIAVNVIVFLLQMQMGQALLGAFALWPPGSGLFMPWQLVTYAFLHGSMTHLAFNMLGLWMFGRELESVWGPKRMAVFYFCSVVAAALLQLLITSASAR